MEYKLKLTETFSRTITVQAETEAQAVETVIILYKDGEINLDFDDFEDYNIEVVEEKK